VFQYSTLAFDVNYELLGAEAIRLGDNHTETPGSAFRDMYEYFNDFFSQIRQVYEDVRL
jgi:hypothetical protein